MENMKRKAVSGIVLMLLLTSMLSSTFNIQPVKTEAGLTENLWPMFQHDAQHTGRSPFVGPGISENPQVITLIGNVSEADYFGPVTIDSNGILYFVARLGGKTGLYAFYPDGSQKWFYEPPALALRGVGPPTLGPDGTIYCFIYLYDGDSKIIAMNSEGTLEWEKSFVGVYPRIYPAIDDQGTIYFLAGGTLAVYSALVALDSVGQIKWVYEVEGSLEAGERSPAIGQDGTIYFGHKDTFFAINPDGTEKWQRTFEGERVKILAPAISSSGIIYAPVNGISHTDYAWTCRLYAISPDGNIVWETTFAEAFWSPPAIGPDGTLYISVYYYAGKYQIYPIWYLTAVDIHGEVKWKVSVGRLENLVVDVEGNVYGHFGQHTVKAFDRDGNQKWSLYLRDGWRSGPLSLGKDGTLYVPGRTWLYAVSPLPPTPPDFSIAASPTSLTIQQGDSDTSVITITSINGFNQPVQLTVSGVPSGVTTTLDPEQVTPPPDSSATSTLTVSVITTATPGSYTLTVTGTNGTLTHSTDITLEACMRMNILPFRERS